MPGYIADFFLIIIFNHVREDISVWVTCMSVQCLRVALDTLGAPDDCELSAVGGRSEQVSPGNRDGAPHNSGATSPAQEAEFLKPS